MNKEQRKFKRVIKTRKIQKAHKQRITNKFGAKLSVGEITEYKSKKYKLSKKKK